MRAVSKDKRKLKGIWFDLYNEYKTKEEANKVAKKLRKDKSLLVRVVRDYYWTDNTTYYLYTSELKKRFGTVNFYNNLFDSGYS